MNEAMPQQKDRGTRPVLISALITSVVLIVFIAYFWDLIDIFTPFLMTPIGGVVWVAFLSVAAWSLIHICRKKRFRQAKSYGPLMVQLAAYLIVATVPLTKIMLDLDFRLHLKARGEIVSKILTHELRPNVPHNSTLIHLPPEYRHLSKGGGEIMVERHADQINVFFFTYRGILDNFSGFMYRSSDTPPEDGEFAGTFFETKRLRKNWYWTAAH